MINKTHALAIVFALSTGILCLHSNSYASEINYLYDSLATKAEEKEISKKIVEEIADITVKIIAGDEGSGIILDKDQNGQYVVITAWHNIKSVGTNEDIIVITRDGKEHIASKKEFYNFPEHIKDAPVKIRFKSNNNYQIARMLPNEEVQALKIYTPILVSGFKRLDNKLTISFGKLLSKRIELNNSIYGLNYTNHTSYGMSGGGIFDNSGKLIGIHGQSEIDIRAAQLEDTYQKSGTSKGMPIFKADSTKLEEISVWDQHSEHEVRSLIRALEATNKNKASFWNYLKLGNLYSRIKHHAKAERAYTLALNFTDKVKIEDYEFEILLLMRAMSRIEQSRTEEAKTDLYRLIEFQEKTGRSTVNSYLMLIRILPQEQRLAATEEWMQTKSNEDITSLAYLYLSNLYFKEINPENEKDDNDIFQNKSIEYGLKAVKKCREEKTSCKHIEIPYAEKLASKNSESYLKALLIINGYIELDKTNPNLYVNRSSIHLSGGKFDEALDDLFQAIAIERYHPRANYWVNYYQYMLSKTSSEEDKKQRLNACSDMIKLQKILQADNTSFEYIDDFIEVYCATKNKQ